MALVVGCSCNTYVVSLTRGIAIARSRLIAPAHGDHAGSRIDGESSTIVIEQAVGDGVVGRIGIASGSRDTYGRTDRGIFANCVGGCVGIVTGPTLNSSTSLIAIV